MSYLVGKIVYKDKKIVSGNNLLVRFYRNSGMLVFKLDKKVVCRCLRSDVLSIVSFNDVYHKSIPGFEYNKFLKTSKELHDEFVYEKGCSCGSEEFYVVSVLCYLFCLNKSFIMRVGEKYVACLKRSEVKKGRKVGTKIVAFGRDEASLSEAIERKKWNQDVAVRKGILGLYVEAEKEYCKEAGIRFDLDMCEKEFKKRVDF